MDKPSEQRSVCEVDASPDSSAFVLDEPGDCIVEPFIVEVLGEPHKRSGAKGARDFAQVMEENVRLQGLLDSYQAALDRHAIVAVTDRRGRMVFVNGKFCSISGYSSWELLGRSHRIVNSGHHTRAFFVEMWQTIARGEVWHNEICNRSKSGELYWVDTTIVPIMDRQRRIEAYVSIRYDITKRKFAEEALQDEVSRRRKAEALLLDVIETVPDGIAAFDTEDRLVLHNQAYTDFYSRSQDVIRVGATFESIVRHGLENGQYIFSRNTHEAKEAWYQARLRDHASPGKKSVQALAGGRWLQVNERRSPSGNTVGTRTDITELKRSEVAIKHHAEHDPLTNLFNRSVLAGRLSQAIAGSMKSGVDGALIVADLDGFKQVNDTMGHAAGDALLVAVARRLEGMLRKSDTVIRLGGDEFAIILPQAGRSDVERITEKLLVAMLQPVLFQKRAIKPQLSMGACLFPRDGRRVDGLLKKADFALYQAKAESRGKCRIFSRSMSALSEQRRKMAGALAAAVAADQIEIALQPQFSLSDTSHSGFEALARWRHANQAVGPAEFIPIAEERGLIIELGKQVLRKALQAIRSMEKQGLNAGQVAVNIAAAQVRMPEFPTMLLAMAADCGLSPSKIEVELTENILLDEEHDQIGRALAQLRGMGFSVALDDFGTGYASLAHLRRFPVNRIKIDRSFVRDMPSNPDALTIVRATVGLAHNLGMQVVAEGIETTEQLAMLHAINCDFGQGYLVSPPLAVDAVSGFLGARR